jgi:diketogulonate reductase-like aldo/keto reductase
MKENIDVFDFELSEEEMESIRKLDTGKSQFFSHRDPEVIKWFASTLEEN